VKIIIQGTTYPLLEATLADHLALKAATGLSRADLEDIHQRVRALSEYDRNRSDEALLLAGITVWFARRRAGENLTLEQACDVPMSEVEFVREPGDPEDVDLDAAGRPDPTRPGSGRVARPADRKRKAGAAKKTSKRPSTAA
jgi:hypothetical protein